MIWILLPLAAAALALRGSRQAATPQPPPPLAEPLPPVEQAPVIAQPVVSAAPVVTTPSAPAGAGPTPDLGAAVAGAAAGAGIGISVAQAIDSNEVVTAVAAAGGAAIGGTAVVAGAALAGTVAAPVVAAVAILRLGQDLWELSVGREDILTAYRARLDEAEKRGGAAGREAERQLVMRENAQRYIDLMREPRINPLESDYTRLKYLVDRGRLLADANGVNTKAELNFEGHFWDWRTGSTTPVRYPQPPTQPTTATVIKVAATRLGTREL